MGEAKSAQNTETKLRIHTDNVLQSLTAYRTSFILKRLKTEESKKLCKSLN